MAVKVAAKSAEVELVGEEVEWVSVAVGEVIGEDELGSMAVEHEEAGWVVAPGLEGVILC